MRPLVLLVVLLLSGPAAAQSLEEMVARLESSPWGWPNGDPFCVDQARRFSFNSDRSYMNSHVSEGDFNVTYQVLGHRPGAITMTIIGEHKQVWDGAQVVWELRFGGADAFCWHNTARPLATCTAFLRRCEAPYTGS